MRLPTRIVSGGQTGVDRGGLDAARALGILQGGWCPGGRKAEDGRIPDLYPLEEHPSLEYSARTEQNVLDSTGTLILTAGDPTGGTSYTIECAQRHGRPHLVLDLDADPDAAWVRSWIDRERIEVLNIAGPRESKCPGVQARAAAFLARVLEA